MKRLSLILLFATSVLYIRGQEDSWILGTERAYRELCEQKIVGLCDFDCDTLYLPNRKRFLFSTTPISLKKGFLSLLTPEEFQVLATSQKFGVKGYSVVWTVHNNRLYLQTVHPYANDYAKRVSEVELKQRVEKLVGSAFDSNGCIFASWVSGDWVLYTQRPPTSFFQTNEEFDAFSLGNYCITIKKGIVRKIEKWDMQTEMRQEIRKREKKKVK